MSAPNVCVVGLGYMGLPTALLLAQSGCTVIGYDISEERVRLLNQGTLPFEEKGLPELFAAGRSRFKAVHQLSELQHVDAFIVCVPTPFTADKTCDLTYVNSAMESLVPHIKKDVLVVLESTVSPGTTKDLVAKILANSGLAPGKDFHLAYVSEKAIPGNTIHEMVHVTRIVGGINDRSATKARELYQLFVKGEIFTTDTVTAEMTKLVENTSRDINIAFANELAKICEGLKIDVWEVISYANRHPRVKILSPGPGVGGHCIAIDPWFIYEGYQSRLIEIARSINDAMPTHVVSHIKRIIDEKKLTDPSIGILGVAYKKNVDDYRETPAERIIELCQQLGWKISAHDPLVKGFTHELVDLDTVLAADIIVIVTDHDFYSSIDLSEKVVLDTRNMRLRAKEYHLLGSQKGV